VENNDDNSNEDSDESDSALDSSDDILQTQLLQQDLNALLKHGR